MFNDQDNLLGMYLARLLAEKSGLALPEKERFADIVQSLVEFIGEGHSCLPLTEPEELLLRTSNLVSSGGETPLVLYNNTLYLHRYYHYERRLALQMKNLARREVAMMACGGFLDEAFGPGDGEDLQRTAAQLAAGKALAILSGGPGTGKTSTVVRILGILFQLLGLQTRVALTAPTGKAAMRLQQSVVGAVDSLPFSEEIRQAIPGRAMTLHRLLGVKKYSPKFRHNRDNPLPWDVVIVDEASMVDLALMSKLVDALHDEARLILLGDKDQLASVESGAVLADLIESLPQNTVVLKKSYRFNEAIRALAEAVNLNQAEKAWSLLQGAFDNIRLLETGRHEKLYQGYEQYLEYAGKANREQYPAVFQEFSKFRILCATRSGRMGVDAVNALIENHGVTRYGYTEKWYPGKPVLIRRNDYTLDLYNGDIGICLRDPEDGSMKIWFEEGDGAVKSYLPSRLPEFQTAYAMTIHKSQGSEFDDVVIVLPDEENQILSRELLYTAITRARKKIWLHSRKEMFMTAVSRKTRRSSGLAAMLRVGEE